MYSVEISCEVTGRLEVDESNPDAFYDADFGDAHDVDAVDKGDYLSVTGYFSQCVCGIDDSKNINAVANSVFETADFKDMSDVEHKDFEFEFYTTVSQMKKLKKGDKFFINNQPHTCSVDAHISGDASYDGYIVYDEDNEGWFEDDFCDD